MPCYELLVKMGFIGRLRIMISMKRCARHSGTKRVAGERQPIMIHGGDEGDRTPGLSVANASTSFFPFSYRILALTNFG